MPRCVICGEHSNQRSPTHSSYVCPTCMQHLRFCASFDQLMSVAEMPAKDDMSIQRHVATRAAQRVPQRA